MKVDKKRAIFFAKLRFTTTKSMYLVTSFFADHDYENAIMTTVEFFLEKKVYDFFPYNAKKLYLYYTINRIFGSPYNLLIFLVVVYNNMVIVKIHNMNISHMHRSKLESI